MSSQSPFDPTAPGAAHRASEGRDDSGGAVIPGLPIAGPPASGPPSYGLPGSAQAGYGPVPQRWAPLISYVAVAAVAACCGGLIPARLLRRLPAAPLLAEE